MGVPDLRVGVFRFRFLPLSLDLCSVRVTIDKSKPDLFYQLPFSFVATRTTTKSFGYRLAVSSAVSLEAREPSTMHMELSHVIGPYILVEGNF